MAFVPGYQHDVFVSPAHGDDREWIRRLVGRLESELKKKLGPRLRCGSMTPICEGHVTIGKRFLRRSRTAVFLFTAIPRISPLAILCRDRVSSICGYLTSKKLRFPGNGFANDRHALRCPSEQIDNNDHWQLFPGVTASSFFDGAGTYVIDKTKFERSFSQLRQELIPLLKRMRNQCTPVFLYMFSADPDLRVARKA